MRLDRVKIGATCVIRAVGGDGALRRRLLEMGLTPRTAVTVVRRAPLGDPIELRLRGYTLTLRRGDARQIDVVEVEASPD